MKVNGSAAHIADPGRRLLDYLRDDLGLKGAKEGCGMGECGACTVLVDDEAVCSCLVLVGQVANAEITTVEAIGGDDDLAPLQRAFVDHHASQCGFCTPGFIMAASALFASEPNPDDEAILAALEGNLCRCTGYGSILSAVKSQRHGG